MRAAPALLRPPFRHFQPETPPRGGTATSLRLATPRRAGRRQEPCRSADSKATEGQDQGERRAKALGLGDAHSQPPFTQLSGSLQTPCPIRRLLLCAALVMHYPEEKLLLRLEEVFSTSLGYVNSFVLWPLLSADLEPQARECLGLLHQLHQSSQRLWEVTEESLRSLRERLHPSSSSSLESLLLLHGADRILQVYMEYIESYTSCMVAPAFLKTAEGKSELRPRLWKMLQELQLLKQLRDYVQLLLSLEDSIRECHPARELVRRAVTIFENLQLFLGQALDQAKATQDLWSSLSSPLRDVLFRAAHCLLHDSQDSPVKVTPLRAKRVLLFDDALVLLQGHSVHTFDLRLVWVDPGKDGCTVHLLMPEKELCIRARDPEDRMVWQWKVIQAVCQALRGKKDFPVLGVGPEPPECPACRTATYTFLAPGRLSQATYEGEWCRARPHGRGTLKWPDGRNHVGGFHQGLEHGFGICLVPQASKDKFDCYKCHWQGGSMCGYGICEYSTDEVYKGYFQAGLRHGFGVLDSSKQAPRPFRYTGHWEKDQRSGYGVEEDKDRGERYIGLWQAGQRHGPGLVVTQAGDCYQGTFRRGRTVGPGVLLTKDDTMYEGTFSRDLTLLGKGKVTFPCGFILEGSFSSKPRKGLYTQGVLDRAALALDMSSVSKRQLGLGAFPVDSRWQGVYGPFRDFVRAGCPKALEEALLGFHGQSSRELQGSQKYLFSERKHPKDDALEELLQPREPKALQEYLKRALSDPSHPLGKLLRTLMLTFQATYAGIGASKHLQGLAQEEVKQHARELWAAYRGLLRVALQRKGQDLEEEEDAETRTLWVHGLMLPLVLPSFYSELFTLYLLLHEREDSLYSQGLTSLSLVPDAQLLEYLDVQKQLRPPKDLKLTTNQRLSLVKDKCFWSATECLQKIMTTVDPREKLEMLERTYREIEATVAGMLGQDHRLPMDELLPLLIYVVSRARIQHLGAEIHLLRDMMHPSPTGGLQDFLLTVLESCYKHIQKEDVRLCRLPHHWDPRERR